MPTSDVVTSCHTLSFSSQEFSVLSWCDIVRIRCGSGGGGKIAVFDEDLSRFG